MDTLRKKSNVSLFSILKFKGEPVREPRSLEVPVIFFFSHITFCCTLKTRKGTETPQYSFLQVQTEERTGKCVT